MYSRTYIHTNDMLVNDIPCAQKHLCILRRFCTILYLYGKNEKTRISLMLIAPFCHISVARVLDASNLAQTCLAGGLQWAPRHTEPQRVLGTSAVTF